MFGGRSSEHEVSLTSAVGILKNIDQDKFDILPVRISKAGRWWLLPDAKTLSSVEDLENTPGRLVLPGDPEANGFFCGEMNEDGTVQSLQIELVDAVFPILHGTFGEDGTLQGLMAMANLPCVGGGVMASSTGMDKIMTKQIYFQNDLPGVDFLWFLRKDWEKNREAITQGVSKEIGFPCFIKPANSGSSVGVYKAHDEGEFGKFMDKAVVFDRKILVEKGVDARELECAVLGNDEPQASVIGEILPSAEFYDYEAKYASAESKTVIPADIPKDLANTLQHLAIKSFKAIDCAGMGRVDFLLEKGTNRIFVNEINTLPGFTPISMYPQLWEASGLSYKDLITRLIELAIERHEDLNNTQYQRN